LNLAIYKKNNIIDKLGSSWICRMNFCFIIWKTITVIHYKKTLKNPMIISNAENGPSSLIGHPLFLCLSPHG
jgi:hypothetical protein